MKTYLKLFLLLTITFESPAVQFMVDTTADTLDALPGNSTCADSGGACSLRGAIMEANALAGDDEVLIPPGNYNLSLIGIDEDAAFSGDLDITETLVLSSSVLGQLPVIDATGIDRVFDVRQSAALVSFFGLVIRGGSASITSNPEGGGILVEDPNTKVSLSFSVVENNRAELGGGISNHGEMTINAVIIQDNTIVDVGILNRDGVAIESGGGASLNMFESSIINNVNNSGTGGAAAIRSSNATEINLINVTLSNNSARGINLSNTDARISSSTITDNAASRGISHFSFDGSHQLTIENTIIANHPSDCSIDVGVNSFSFNISSDDTCFGSGGGNQINTDPRLLPLRFDGLSPYRPLADDSPAVDMASPAAPGGASPACPLLDQLLSSRPLDGDADGIARCDIGAVESGLIFKNGFET